MPAIKDNPIFFRGLILLFAGLTLLLPPSFAAAEKSGEPLLSLSVNDSYKPVFAPGEPLLMKVQVLHSEGLRDEPASDLILESGAEDWSELLSVEIKDEKKNPQTWTLERVPLKQKEPKLTLRQDGSAEVHWTLSPEASRSIAPGKYSARAKFKGKLTLQSPIVRILVSAEPQKTDEIAILSRKGDILLAQGKKTEALSAYNEALAKESQKSGRREPLRGLSAKRNQLAMEILNSLPAGKIKAGAGAAPALPGPFEIKLEWKEKVDVDLWIENQEGARRPVDAEAAEGPGVEIFRPQGEKFKKLDSTYYVTAYLASAQPGEKTEVTLTLNVPGSPSYQKTALLSYDGNDYWIAASIDLASWKITEINAYDASVAEYLDKNKSG